MQDNNGCNWPLRSGKGSQFNGGVKGISFLSGSILPNKKNLTVYEGMLHSVDWLPTLMRFIGGSTANRTFPLDGYDQWNEILNNQTSKRNEILLNTVRNQVDAYIMGDWKYISGKVVASYDGWIPVPNTTQSCIYIFNYLLL